MSLTGTIINETTIEYDYDISYDFVNINAEVSKVNGKLRFKFSEAISELILKEQVVDGVKTLIATSKTRSSSVVTIAGGVMRGKTVLRCTSR
jgi:hypothetical protein